MYLEEFLTDYRASLLRKCKALMKVLIIALAKKLMIASLILSQRRVMSLLSRPEEGRSRCGIRFVFCQSKTKKQNNSLLLAEFSGRHLEEDSDD